MEESLQRYFGYTQFREGQREIIQRILDNEDVCVVMPTGAGKSLCYQLPILMKPGYGLVISPLIALMADQVNALNALGLRAVCVNSAQPPATQNIALRDIAAGYAKFLYVSPERFRVANFQNFIQDNPPSLVVVDEAHCISQWGHDFRPDYQRIWSTTPALSKLQICAFTATATPHVRDDIREQLGRPDMQDIVTGFRRENLRFSVLACQTKAQKCEYLEALLQTKVPTLIYVSTRKEAEKLSYDYGIRIYHAGMSDMARRDAQQYFTTDPCPILAATNAFGMGIDRADIRRVIHFNLPGSLEAYYQEAGRAGRDGKPAECILISCYADIRIQQYLMEINNPPFAVFKALHAWLRHHAHADGSLIWQPDVAFTEIGTDEAKNAAQLSVAVRILERQGLLQRTYAHLPETIGTLHFLSPIDELEKRHEAQSTQRSIFIYRMIRWMKTYGESAFQGTLDDLAICTGFHVAQLQRILDALLGNTLMWTLGQTDGILVLTEKGKEPKLDMDAKFLKKKADLDNKRLESVISYCTTRDCRQVHIVKYFGEKIGKWRCGCCDKCGNGISGGHDMTDAERAAAMTMLRAISMVDGQFGKRRIISMLQGMDDTNIDLNEHPLKGSLASWDKEKIDELMNALENGEYIGTSPGEYPTMELQPAGTEALNTDGQNLKLVLFGKAPADMPAPAKRRRKNSRSFSKTRRDNWSY